MIDPIRIDTEIARVRTKADEIVRDAKAASDMAAVVADNARAAWHADLQRPAVCNLYDRLAAAYDRERLLSIPYGKSRTAQDAEDSLIAASPVYAGMLATCRASRSAADHYNVVSLSAYCDCTTVNGVYYGRNERKAATVRLALADAGIAHHYPGTPEARKALRAAGVERTPAIGEEWGCGCEYGVIEQFTADSRAIIRQSKPGGLVSVGQTFQLPIHVLSPNSSGC
jgi:hypothetical protein